MRASLYDLELLEHIGMEMRYRSLRITLKYTTLVSIRIGPREPAWHGNGAEVTNGLQ